MSAKYRAGVLIRYIRILQKQYPEAVYKKNTKSSGCYYSQGSISGGPKTKGCIVGQAIRHVYPDLFQEIKGTSYDESSVDAIIDNFDFDCTVNQRHWLMNFQNNQDSQNCWGVCHKDIE
jgi:hypothetical protein